MLELIKAVVLTGALLIACGGVGGTILRWAHLDEPGEKTAARPMSFGVCAAFGLAILIAFGGLGVVLHIPVAVTVALFSATGIALQAVHVVRHRPRWTGPWVVVLVVEAVALGLVLLTQAGVGIAFRLNVCDDVLAYLPEARRLLSTHTLIEPWSTRRLQNYGGQTFLQASYIRFLGKTALGLTETLLPVAFLWALLSTALRRPLTRLVAVVPLLFLPFFDVARANTAGTLSLVPLLVVLGALVLVLRRAAQEANRRGTFVAAAALGVTAAAAVAIRTNTTPAAALIVAVGIGTTAGTIGDKVRAGGVCLAAGLAAFAPWSIAMWQSSETPLYPVLAGNENQRVPSVGGTNSMDFGDFLHTARHFFTGGVYPAALVVILVLAVAGWRVFPKTAPIAALMAGAGLANMILLVPNISLVAIRDFDRYTFPLAAGVLFFVLRGALVRLDEEWPLLRRPALAPAVFAAAALAAFFWVGTRGPDAIVNVSNVDAARGYVERAADVSDPDAHVTSNAAVTASGAALAAVPPGAKTMLAVSEPDAFLTLGADLQSIDEPGFAAPGGKFPFFSGPKAKVRALRDAGFDHLIVSVGPTYRCFEHARMEMFLNDPVLGLRLQAPYVLDFVDDIDRLAQRYPQATQTVDSYYVIDLRAVPGTAPRRAES